LHRISTNADSSNIISSLRLICFEIHKTPVSHGVLLIFFCFQDYFISFNFKCKAVLVDKNGLSYFSW